MPKGDQAELEAVRLSQGCATGQGQVGVLVPPSHRHLAQWEHHQDGEVAPVPACLSSVLRPFMAPCPRETCPPLICQPAIAAGK